MELDWEDVRFFLAAWEAESLSVAARRLRVGQATMSRRIAQLEEKAGHVLFDRTRNGLRATAAAEALHPYATSMAEAARQGAAALQGLEVEPEGVVRVALPPGLAVDLLPPLLPELQRRWPRLRLEALSDNLPRDLPRREADIALRSIRPEAGDLIFRRLPDVRQRVYASAEYISRLPPGVTARDLDWIQYSDELAHIQVARWVDEVLAGRRPVFTSNSFLAMRAAALAGLGAMVLPELQARVVGLVEAPVDTTGLPDVPWYLVVHRALRRVPRVAVIVDFLLEVAALAPVAERWPPRELLTG